MVYLLIVISNALNVVIVNLSSLLLKHDEDRCVEDHLKRKHTFDMTECKWLTVSMVNSNAVIGPYQSVIHDLISPSRERQQVVVFLDSCNDN